MDIDKFVHCLHSKTRRRILQLLSNKDMTAPQIYKALKNEAPKFRQSVNKALEVLREGGLIVKYYDAERKAIYYHLVKKVFVVKIPEMEVE